MASLEVSTGTAGIKSMILPLIEPMYIFTSTTAVVTDSISTLFLISH